MTSMEDDEQLAKELEERIARNKTKRNPAKADQDPDHLSPMPSSQNQKRMSLGDKWNALTNGVGGAETPIDKALGDRRGSLTNAKKARDMMQKVVDNATKIEAKGANTRFQKFLQSYTVAQLIELNKDMAVIEVDGSASPQEGFEVLLRNNILGAPVWDKKKSKYVGFLDIRDLVSALVFSRDSKKLPDWQEQMVHGLENIQTRRGSFEEKKKSQEQTKPIITATYLAGRNPFKPVTTKSSLWDVACILSGDDHRVAVVDDNGKCTSIISQSNFIKFFELHKAEIGSDLDQSVDDVGFPLKKVITVASTETALNAFKTLDKFRISGLGVVAEDGSLIGNTSAQDLKFHVLDKGRESMSVPILTYLSKIRQREVTARDRYPICSVKKTDTLGRIIGLLAATRYHRIFVEDDRRNPIGVCSITDILKFATRIPQNPTPVTSSASSPRQLSSSPAVTEKSVRERKQDN